MRHYTWSGLAEARKVLGGAGPGLLQIPGSVLWAGISLVDLTAEVAARKRSPLQLPPALGHVSFTLVAQLVGVSARFLQVGQRVQSAPSAHACSKRQRSAAVLGGRAAQRHRTARPTPPLTHARARAQALMAAVPVERQGPLSDHGLLQRYLHTPQTAGDAFYQAALEAYLGLYAGFAGLVLDPLEGFRLPGGGRKAGWRCGGWGGAWTGCAPSRVAQALEHPGVLDQEAGSGACQQAHGGSAH